MDESNLKTLLDKGMSHWPCIVSWN